MALDEVLLVVACAAWPAWPGRRYAAVRIRRMVFVIRSQGVQWPVGDWDSLRLELEDGSILGELSGEGLRAIVQHHLATATLHAAIAQDLERRTPPDVRPPAVAPDSVGAAQRAAYRHQRRSRRRKESP